MNFSKVYFFYHLCVPKKIIKTDFFMNLNKFIYELTVFK